MTGGKDPRTHAAASLCRALGDEGLPFVVPRNFELPVELVGDLDVWFRPGDLREAASIVREAAGEAGWSLLSRWSLPWHVQLTFWREACRAGEPPLHLAVDLEAEVGRKGYRYAPLEPFLRDRVWEGPIPRPADDARAVALALHAVLSKGTLSRRYREVLLSCPVGAFSRFAAAVLPAPAARRLTGWLEDGATEASLPDLSRDLRRRLLIRRPGSPMRRAYVRARARARFLMPRRGFLVAFVGPDGGGKSTTAALVRERLPRLPTPVPIVYMGKKHAVLPTSRLIRWISSSFGTSPLVPGPPHRDDEDPDTETRSGEGSPAEGTSFLTRVADVLGLANWVAEQWWRYLTKIRPVLQQNGIVLTDRYFLDFVQRPDGSAAHREGVRRLLLRLFPEPDLTVLLWADPATLRERKPSTDGTDPADVLSRMRRAVEHYADTIQVATGSGTPRATATALAGGILERMSDR